MAEHEQLLRVEEAARRLSISRAKMYELLNEGAIGSVKIGRLRRISTEALRAYLASVAQQPPPR